MKKGNRISLIIVSALSVAVCGIGVYIWAPWSNNHKEVKKPQQTATKKTDREAILKAETERLKAENRSKELDIERDKSRAKADAERRKLLDKTFPKGRPSNATPAMGTGKNGNHVRTIAEVDPNAPSGECTKTGGAKTPKQLSDVGCLVDACAKMRKGTDEDSRPLTYVCRDTVNQRWYNLCSSNWSRIPRYHWPDVSSPYEKAPDVQLALLPSTIMLGGTAVAVKHLDCYKVLRRGFYHYAMTNYDRPTRRSRARHSRSSGSGTYATKSWVRDNFATKGDLAKEREERIAADQALDSFIKKSIKHRRGLQPLKEVPHGGPQS